MKVFGSQSFTTAKPADRKPIRPLAQQLDSKENVNKTEKIANPNNYHLFNSNSVTGASSFTKLLTQVKNGPLK
jgi:hypothetical protein